MKPSVHFYMVAPTQAKPMIVHVSKSIPEKNVRSLFATEQGGGITFTLDEIERQSKIYADFYLQLISAFARTLSEQLGITETQAAPFARSAIVPLSNFYFDRLLRLERISRYGPFAVANPGPLTLPVTAEEFGLAAMFSPRFNQWMIMHQAPLFLAPLDNETLGSETESSVSPPGLVNYNNILDWKFFRRKLLAIRRIVSRKLGAYPALELALIKPALIEARCFGLGRFADIDTDWGLTAALPEKRLRELVIDRSLSMSTGAIDNLLRQLDIPLKTDAVIASFAAYCRAAYPSHLLEAVPANLPRVIKWLRQYQGKAYLMGNVNFSTRGSYLRAAARTIGARLIGCQHGGGNYAYIRDYSTGIEGELAQCDQFITWGWKRIADHPALDQLELTPLPSPFLAARCKKWLKELGTPDQRLALPKQYDVLLMPNKIYPFPPAPTGAALSTVDHIKAFSALLKDFVSGCAEAGVAVYHKPYNQSTANLLKETLAALPVLGGPFYTCETKMDKGLHSALIASSRVIVWDQPGSGFLECLTAEIPTMLLWPRHFNRETSWAEPAFQELERVGVIFRDVRPLLAELKRFKQEPPAWMRDPQRRKAISAFCREFAWIDDHWQDNWRSFIDSL